MCARPCCLPLARAAAALDLRRAGGRWFRQRRRPAECCCCCCCSGARCGDDCDDCSRLRHSQAAGATRLGQTESADDGGTSRLKRRAGTILEQWPARTGSKARPADSHCRPLLACSQPPPAAECARALSACLPASLWRVCAPRAPSRGRRASATRAPEFRWRCAVVELEPGWPRASVLARPRASARAALRRASRAGDGQMALKAQRAIPSRSSSGRPDCRYRVSGLARRAHPLWPRRARRIWEPSALINRSRSRAANSILMNSLEIQFSTESGERGQINTCASAGRFKPDRPLD